MTDFGFYILFIITVGEILVLYAGVCVCVCVCVCVYIYMTRLASNEIFSPSNKMRQEVGQAKDLSAPL